MYEPILYRYRPIYRLSADNQFCRYENFLLVSVIGIGIGRYRKFCIGNLSVSADIKIGFIGDYRYRPIWKKSYRSYTDLRLAMEYV